MDEFYRTDIENKKVMVHKKPQLDGDPRNLAFVASAVHRLCRLEGMETPDWIFSPETILKEPYFVGNPGDQLRMVCLVESPPEFKMRNVFVTDTVLSRA